MIGVLARNDCALSGLSKGRPVMADETDVGVVGLGPGIRKKCAGHAVGCDLRQLLGQGDHRRVGRHEEGVVIGKLAHLTRSDLRQLRPAIAKIDAPKARHSVEDLVAVAVGQPDALCSCYDPRAFGTDFPCIGEWM